MRATLPRERFVCLSVWVETAVASKKGIAFLEDKIRGECEEMGTTLHTGVVKGVRALETRTGPPTFRANVAEPTWLVNPRPACT